nr:regulatory protein RecX [Corynebacterium lactis]
MTSKQRTIEALAQQIAEADGSTLFDSGREEAKAPVRARALRLLDQRMRSRKELSDRLGSVEEFAPEIISEVIDDLARGGLVNDRLFASEWVRQRFELRGKSRAFLDKELREKGISAADRAEALEQVTRGDEEALAYKLAEKKSRSIRSLPDDYVGKQRDLRKVVGVLARRGFPSELSMRVARGALEDRYGDLSAD